MERDALAKRFFLQDRGSINFIDIRYYSYGSNPMTDDLTDDDSLPESHCSKTCKASSYGAELSATSKNESQINSTEGLSDCLARFNALQQAVDEEKVKAFTPLREEGGITYYQRSDWHAAICALEKTAPEILALANKLHDENERVTVEPKYTREEFVEIISAIAFESEKLRDLLHPREPYSLRFSLCGALRVIHALEQAGALQVKPPELHNDPDLQGRI